MTIATGQQATAADVNALRLFTELAGGQDLAPSSGAATWENYDLSAIIGAGAIAVLVGIKGSVVASITGGARNNGSALNRVVSLTEANRVTLVTQCDANRIIEIYGESATQGYNARYSILGYWV